jgi:hypothetical protein
MERRVFPSIDIDACNTNAKKKEFAPVHMNDMKKLKNYIFIYLFALKSF